VEVARLQSLLQEVSLRRMEGEPTQQEAGTGRRGALRARRRLTDSVLQDPGADQHVSAATERVVAGAEVEATKRTTGAESDAERMIEQTLRDHFSRSQLLSLRRAVREVLGRAPELQPLEEAVAEQLDVMPKTRVRELHRAVRKAVLERDVETCCRQSLECLTPQKTLPRTPARTPTRNPMRSPRKRRVIRQGGGTDELMTFGEDEEEADNGEDGEEEEGYGNSGSDPVKDAMQAWWRQHYYPHHLAPLLQQQQAAQAPSGIARAVILQRVQESAGPELAAVLGRSVWLGLGG
ncbi:hypothetical protein Agub_g14101, partial [Astrephomene gubernaculifera]